MTKYILLSSFLIAFAFLSAPISSANAACAKCAEAQAYYDAKKSKKAGKKCGCKKAKICEKTLTKKKTCVKCLKSEQAYEASKSNKKGSLVIKSGTSFKSGGTASYNQ